MAEKANITTQYIAMIEVSRKFPSPEMLDRLAGALGMEAYELFAVNPSSAHTMEQLHDSIISNIEQAVNRAVEKAISNKCTSAEVQEKKRH